MAQLINGTKRWKQFVKSSLNVVQDPVFLTFDLDFLLDINKPELRHQQTASNDGLYFDGLFKAPREDKPDTNEYNIVEWAAIDWLYTYGSPWTKKNFQYLADAQVLLKQLQDSPWYFQSIMGIDQLWKAASRVKEGDKKVEITINCLDSIQQPLLKFAESYRRAIYDFDKLCYTLPDNLRTFDMTITLFEIRDINDPNGNLEDGLHQLKYRLQRCEFDFSDILNGVGSTEIKSYIEEKPFTTSFKIRAAWVMEESEASTESNYHSLGIFSGLASSLGNKAQNLLGSIARLPARIIGDLTNQLQTKLETALGENVYNRTTEVLGTNQLFGRTSPVGPGGGGAVVNDDIYPGVNVNPNITKIAEVYSDVDVKLDVTNIDDIYPGVDVKLDVTNIDDIYPGVDVKPVITTGIDVYPGVDVKPVITTGIDVYPGVDVKPDVTTGIDVYPGVDVKDIIKDGDLGDVYP